jgi:hypothetical protein
MAFYNTCLEKNLVLHTEWLMIPGLKPLSPLFRRFFLIADFKDLSSAGLYTRIFTAEGLLAEFQSFKDFSNITARLSFPRGFFKIVLTFDSSLTSVFAVISPVIYSDCEEKKKLRVNAGFL